MVQTLSTIHARYAARVDPIRPLLELGALALTASLHLLWPSLGLSRALLVLPLVVGWLSYFALRWRLKPKLIADLGFRRQGLWESARLCGLLILVAAPAMLTYGWWHEAELTWAFGLTLLVYPVWGLVQQLLLQGLISHNLDKYLPVAATTLISSTLFGLVHWNEPILVGATFLLGLVLTPLYLKHRNLWALGVAHGWLGSLIYPLVLLREPLAAYLPV